jgi:hypothetical protein
MEGKTEERWFQLCQLASVEQDSERLIKLAEEIAKLLEEREERLKEKRSGAGASS